MVKLIASDLDGTLLQNGAQKLNPIVFTQIKKLKEKGIHFVAASGRQYASLQRLFAPVKDDISYIAENGSLCIFNGQTLFQKSLEPELTMRIIHAIHEYDGCDCIISGKDVCYTDSKNQRFIDHLIHVVGNNVEVIEHPSYIREPFLKISVCDFNGIKDCEAYFKNLFSSEIKIATSGNIWVDFITPYADKGTALKELLLHLSIRPEDCVAFGDQYNDVEMLSLVGTSYAMTNAAPGISHYTTDTTDSVEEVLADIIKGVEI